MRLGKLSCWDALDMDSWERIGFFGLSDFRIVLRQWYVSGWGKRQYIDICFFNSTKSGAQVRFPYLPTWTIVLRTCSFSVLGDSSSSAMPWQTNLTVSSVFCKLWDSMIDCRNHVKADWSRSVAKLYMSKGKTD